MTFSEINATKNVRKMSWAFLNIYAIISGVMVISEEIKKKRSNKKDA